MKDVSSPESLHQKIYLIRGQKVMLSPHLAELYGVRVKALVQAVKRNRERFPGDFTFLLTDQEVANLKSQFGFGLINSVDDACRCTLGADVF
jgi:hypothetical protein